MVRYLFYTIGDLTYQSPLVSSQMGQNQAAPTRREGGELAQITGAPLRCMCLFL